MSISTAMSPRFDVSVPGCSPADRASAHTLQRLALPYDLLLQRPTPMQLDTLLQTAVNWLVDVISDATHGALMLKDPATGDLSLRVHRPIGEPVVSLTLVKQVMEKQGGVIWRRGEAEISASDLPPPVPEPEPQARDGVAKASNAGVLRRRAYARDTGTGQVDGGPGSRGLQHPGRKVSRRVEVFRLPVG